MPSWMSSRHHHHPAHHAVRWPGPGSRRQAADRSEEAHKHTLMLKTWSGVRLCGQSEMSLSLGSHQNKGHSRLQNVFCSAEKWKQNTCRAFQKSKRRLPCQHEKLLREVLSKLFSETNTACLCPSMRNLYTFNVFLTVEAQASKTKGN